MTTIKNNAIMVMAISVLWLLPGRDLVSVGYTADSLAGKLYSQDLREREGAREVIAKDKPGDLLLFLRGEILSKNDLERKYIALETLKLYPFQENLELWLDLLKNTPSFMIKKYIIDYIGPTGDRRVVMPLVEEMKNPFATVRESANRALKKLGDDRMFPHVLNMARDTNPIFRIYALEAMYYLYDRRMNAVLLDMMKDENKSVRYYVLKCIENNKLIETLPQIRSIALADANWEVRIKAIEVIREFNDKNALYVLVKSVTDANRDIRHASAVALRDLRIAGAAHPVSVQLATEEDDGIKNVLIEALIRVRSTGGLTGLQKILLTEKNVGLRVRAAFALGEIGDARSVTLLYQGLNDCDPKVKAEVCNSLAVFRGVHATVIKLLDVVNSEQDNYVRLSALYALQRLGDRNIILPLFDLYGVETDPVFREKLRITLRRFLER